MPASHPGAHYLLRAPHRLSWVHVDKPLPWNSRILDSRWALDINTGQKLGYKGFSLHIHRDRVLNRPGPCKQPPFCVVQACSEVLHPRAEESRPGDEVLLARCSSNDLEIVRVASLGDMEGFCELFEV